MYVSTDKKTNLTTLLIKFHILSIKLQSSIISFFPETTIFSAGKNVARFQVDFSLKNQLEIDKFAIDIFRRRHSNMKTIVEWYCNKKKSRIKTLIDY